MKMGSPTKGFTFLFLAAFAVFVNTDAAEQRTQIGNSVPINVSYAAKVAVPILFHSQDYTGPYDPADPKGIGAANRRHAKIQNQKRVQVVKSYIPPGVNKVAKKEVVHLAMSEGRRFAISHPKEAAEVIGIATKVKGLIHDAARKVKKTEDKERRY